MNATRRAPPATSPESETRLRAAPTAPYVVISRRGRLAQLARTSLRSARVYHGRATNRVQYFVALMENGVEITHSDLDTLAHDLRRLGSTLVKAALDVDDVVQCAQETALTVPLREPR